MDIGLNTKHDSILKQQDSLGQKANTPEDSKQQKKLGSGGNRPPHISEKSILRFQNNLAEDDWNSYKS